MKNIKASPPQAGENFEKGRHNPDLCLGQILIQLVFRVAFALRALSFGLSIPITFCIIHDFAKIIGR